MNILQKIFKSSKPILTLFALSLSLLGVVILGNYSNVLLIVLSAMFVSSFIYVFNAFTDVEEDKINKPKRIFNSASEINMLLISCILFLVFALFLSFISSIFSFFIVIIIAVIGFFYSFKINGFRFKKYAFTKSPAISLGWCLFVFIGSRSFNFFSISVSLFAALIVFNSSNISDIKDLKGDLNAGIKTIPSIIGIKNLAYLLIILDVASIIILLFNIYNNYLPIYFILMPFAFAFIIGCLIVGVKYGGDISQFDKINFRLWRRIVKFLLDVSVYITFLMVIIAVVSGFI